MHSVELLHPALPELIDALLRRNRWSWQALERGDLKLGDQVLDIDRLQWWLVNSDPVLWVETNLVNKPEDGGGLWICSARSLFHRHWHMSSGNG